MKQDYHLASLSTILNELTILFFIFPYFFTIILKSKTIGLLFMLFAGECISSDIGSVKSEREVLGFCAE